MHKVNFHTNFISILFLLINSLCPAAQEMVTITGRVIDEKALPVEGATVIYYEWRPEGCEPLARSQTLRDGRFSFKMKKGDSSFWLVAGKPGHALGWWETNQGCGDPVIRLGKPGIFKGIVADHNGQSIPDAKVRICLKNKLMGDSEIYASEPEEWFTTKTDESGQFIFENVPKDATADFGVEISDIASVWTFRDFGLRAGEQFVAGRTDIRIEVPEAASIKGFVVDEQTGRAAAGVDVQARPYNRYDQYFHPAPVKTDSNGQFELIGLAPEKYFLQVGSDAATTGYLTIDLKPGQILHDAKVILPKGIPLGVVVYGSEKGDPIENADVTVIQKAADCPYPTFKQTIDTDMNGLARFSVPPGECEIQVVKHQYGLTFDSHRLPVEYGETLRYEISLPHTTCPFSGEVLDEQGNGVAGASILHFDFGLPFTTDTNGTFYISNYYSQNKPSKVRVIARHESTGLAAIGDLQDPNKTGTFHGRIVLKPGYVLTGRVTDITGKSIPAAYVQLLHGRYLRLITEVPTDPNGIYRINSVPAEQDKIEYAVIARAHGYGQTMLSQISFEPGSTEPVQLEPIVLLKADKAISGIVQDSNEQPVPNASVAVHSPELSGTVSQRPCAGTLTDTNGRFRITGLCKEPLRIYVESPSDRQPSGETFVYGGNENIKVILGKTLKFSESLLGKSLPNLKNIKIETPSADYDNKKLLVCFFDFEQRPSRNCISELARQAAELKEKNVIVIPVQASKIRKDKLNKWIRENKIPFPVGILEIKIEETKFTWGVQSLPWLVLTDRKHIVQAEGFGLDEVEEITAQTEGGIRQPKDYNKQVD